MEQDDWSDGPYIPLRRELVLAHEQLEVRMSALLEKHQRAFTMVLSELIGDLPQAQRWPPPTVQILEVPASVAPLGASRPHPSLPAAGIPTSNECGVRPSGSDCDAISSESASAASKDCLPAFGEHTAPPDPQRDVSVLTRGSKNLGLVIQETQSSLKQVRNSVLRGAQDHLECSKGPRECLGSCARWVLKRREFELFVALVVTTNAIGIGLSSDRSIKHPREDSSVGHRAVDWLFLGIFSLELVIRLLAEGRSFFSPRNKCFSWNVFDSLLVALTLFNEFNPLNLSLSVVRVFRVLRLVQVLRMIRLMRSFRELRMMVFGIMNCGKTLLWSLLLLLGITYIYAVICLQLSSEWLASVGEDSAALGQTQLDTIAFLSKHFPSMPWSVYTLFKALSGGITWGEIADPLQHVSVWLMISFPLYIATTVFCVLNVITASFVEAAARTAYNEESNTLEHIDERQSWIQTVTQLFNKHDLDSEGNLDINEFQGLAKDWRTRAYFRQIGIDLDHQSLKKLFKLFDWDGDGRINVDEFAHGIHHLRGTARSLDMYQHFRNINNKIDSLSKHLCALTGPDQSANLGRHSADMTVSERPGSLVRDSSLGLG